MCVCVSVSFPKYRRSNTLTNSFEPFSVIQLLVKRKAFFCSNCVVCFSRTRTKFLMHDLEINAAAAPGKRKRENWKWYRFVAIFSGLLQRKWRYIPTYPRDIFDILIKEIIHTANVYAFKEPSSRKLIEPQAKFLASSSGYFLLLARFSGFFYLSTAKATFIAVYNLSLATSS